MKRNYSDWNRLKINLDKREFSGNFSEREVWWCSLGANIGDEEDGKNKLFERPVLVLKKYSKALFLAVPLSTTQKTGRLYRHLLSGGVESVALLSQGRALSSKRLQRRLGRITETEFADIWNGYSALHEIKSNPQLLGDSRAPNGDLYAHDTNREHKIQGGGQ